MSLLEKNVDTMYHYCMKIQVNQWGNSLAIRIPKSVAEHMQIENGSEVNMDLKDKSLVISKPQYSLDGLMSKITPNTIHPATDWGSPVGKEIW